MKSSRWIAVAGAVCLCVQLLDDADAQVEGRALQAHPRGDQEITVDGQLSEPIWRSAPVASDFVQRAPSPGEPAPVQPTIRVLYDSSALYFGIVVPSGREPESYTLRRDDFLIFNDDALSLKIDANRDGRTTLGFTINSANAQLDYISTDAGRQFLREFDNVWESATAVGPSGWSAELRIPAEALGLRRGEGPVEMGLNVTYEDRTRRGIYDWSPLKPELGATYAPDYGSLTGIDRFRRGLPVMLLPYGLVSIPGETLGGVDLPVRARAGGEARGRVLDDTWVEASLLTDFSQVELDDAVLNLDRFPLFFPEKRPFFLSGLDIFDFGATFNGAPTTVFFSRRIGLDDQGEVIPLWGGVKIYGREGPIRFGVIDVVTDPETNYSVARTRVDIAGSYLGAIAAARNDLVAYPDPDRASENYAGGVDGELRAADGHFRVRGLWATASDERLRADDHMTATTNILWAGRVVSPELNVLYVQPQFEPGIGFVRRTDYATATAILPLVFRTPARAIREVSLQADASYEVDAALDQRLGATAGGRVAADFHHSSVDVRGYATEDRVLETFELFEGVDIPPGVYRGPWTRITVANPAARNPSTALSYTRDGGFFGGVNHSVSGQLMVSATRHARLQTSITESFSKLPGRETIVSTSLNAGLGLAASPRLTSDLAFRLNTQTRLTAALAQIRYRYTTGSDVFLVYRQEAPLDGGYEGSLTLKVTYRFDALL